MSVATVRPAELVRVHIRWMIRRDLQDVMLIERAGFDHPWTEGEFLHCLRQRNCIGMVAEQDERIVGYMLYELTRSRLHLLNFAVAPPVRRTGVGTQMVGKLFGKMHTHRRGRITLAVRERNLPAQLFFRAMDFRASKVLRNYYADSGEDAFLMEHLADPAVEYADFDQPAERFSRF